MELQENLKMAFASLMANKLRTVLTMLGIAIGNGAVISLVGVGQATQKQVAEQFAALGPNVLFVSVTNRNLRSHIPNSRSLNLQDAEAIAKQVPSVERVSPEVHNRRVLTHAGKTTNPAIVGVTGEFLRVRNFQLSKGRFINQVDVRRHNRVVVLGSQAAQDLFGQKNPLGEIIRVQNLSFEVIGVLSPKGALFDSSNHDDQALFPITTLFNNVLGRNSVYRVNLSLISVLVKDKSLLDTAEFQIKNLLRVRHQVDAENYINISRQQAIMDTASATNRELTNMLTTVASISLLVGGIGVMNIMLVSVSERTQEIGLRKALGAKEKDILGQFLIEAIILATSGGTLGIVVSLGSMVVTGGLTALATQLSLPAIALALGVSSGIGLLFGILPAQRAAHLDPIVALRRI
jgi:putative ABC transport system permease protein